MLGETTCRATGICLWRLCQASRMIGRPDIEDDQKVTGGSPEQFVKERFRRLA